MTHSPESPNDGYIDLGVDLTEMPLEELGSTQDPLILAMAERIAKQVIGRPPEEDIITD